MCNIVTEFYRLSIVFANDYTFQRMLNVRLTDTLSYLADAVVDIWNLRKDVKVDISEIALFYTNNENITQETCFTELDQHSSQLREFGIEHMAYIFVIRYVPHKHLIVEKGSVKHDICGASGDETVCSLKLKIQDRLPSQQQNLFATHKPTSILHNLTKSPELKLVPYKDFKLNMDFFPF